MAGIVKVTHLKKSSGRLEALKDVSFTVHSGEITGFIGPNGSGKSTTIRTLLGIIKKDGGTATIFGQNIWEDSLPIHKRLSHVPGDVSLWGNLAGGVVIDLFMKLHGKGSAQRKDELVQRFFLDPKKKAKNYSKGNRQKVGSIAASAVDSDLYLFDEFTSGLDPLMETISQEEVEKLKEQGKSILFSLHILSEVERLADKVVIIREETVVEEGTFDELRHLIRSAIITETETENSHLAQLNGAHDFVQKGHLVQLVTNDEAFDVILAEASKLGAKKFKLIPPTFEDLFMRHYGG